MGNTVIALTNQPEAFFHCGRLTWVSQDDVDIRRENLRLCVYLYPSVLDI